MILKRLVVGPLQENCYIVAAEGSKRGLVIDPGFDADFILEHVQGDGLSIELILNTHAHWDHIGAVAAVKRATQARYALHEAESPILQDRLTRTPSWMAAPPEPVSPDLLLKDGDTLEVEGLSFRVIHTPGHSPGSICIYGQGVVFTGDTLFQGSVGRTDLMGGDWEQLRRSIRIKLLTLPEETLVLPGHGPQSTIEVEKHSNPFLRGC